MSTPGARVKPTESAARNGASAFQYAQILRRCAARSSA